MALELPKIGEKNAAADPKILALLERSPRWYSPKIINTEESRTNTAFGTLTTPDEITGIVVPENGLIAIEYSALVKSAGTGKVAVFIGSNQLRFGASVQEAVPSESFAAVASGASGLANTGGLTSFVATGEVGGLLLVRRLTPGTYTVSIRFKSTSGAITAKERMLQAGVYGS